jgi:hypothetical protein
MRNKDQEEEEDEFRLTIPIEDAFSFSMGEYELGPNETSDSMRQLVGILIIDALEYAESWRLAAEAKTLLAVRWPDCPGFRGAHLDDDPGSADEGEAGTE